MATPAGPSLTYNFTEALRLMEAALADGPDDLWRTDLGPDQAPTRPGPYGGLEGSAPWFLGHHALSYLDHDLTGGFEPWTPPAPFDGHIDSYPDRVFTGPELLGYVEWCRHRVRHTVDALTEELAARTVPTAPRKHGRLFGVLIGNLPLHVVEHAAPIRQFLTVADVTVRPMPGDHGYQD